MTYATTGSPAWMPGDTVTLTGFVTSPVTTVNTTYTVQACTSTTVNVTLAGSGTVTTRGNVSGSPIPNLMVSGKAPMTGSGANTNKVTTTQGLNIGEVIMYNSALTPSAVTSVEKYLRNKWGNVAV